VKIAVALHELPDDVILSEAKNLGSEMFRFAQHDKAIYWISNHAS